MNTVLIDGIEYSLEGLEKDVWLRILNGSVKYKDVLHNPVPFKQRQPMPAVLRVEEACAVMSL